MEANVNLGELQQKIKRLEGLCQVSIILFLLKVEPYRT